ncbi:MAG: hypothetical protein AAF985_14040 [Bacteroidota bacterium]
MNFAAIKANIRAWNDIRTDSRKLLPHFDGEAYFKFDYTMPKGKNVFLHFYPAIKQNGSLVFYLIDSNNDSKEKYQEAPSRYADYFTEAVVQKIPHVNPDDIVVDSRISREAALNRIAKWDHCYEAWITNKAKNGGLFQAFYMPASNSNTTIELNYTGYFGLVPNPIDADTCIGLKEDLILHAETEVFYNTVRPVPPFGDGGRNEEAFWVLKASTSAITI